MQTRNIFQKWVAGELGDEAALEALCQTLVGIQDSLEPLAEMEKQARAQISEVVQKLGGKVHVEGFGELQITSPTVVHAYNREQVDTLVGALIEEGHADIAARIQACRSKRPRTGGLRIDRLNR